MPDESEAFGGSVFSFGGFKSVMMSPEKLYC